MNQTIAAPGILSLLMARYAVYESGNFTVLDGARNHGVAAHISRDRDFRVLYADRVPIIDIDLPNEGMPKRIAALRRVTDYAKANPAFSCRVYVTAGGLRLIVTSELIRAGSPASGAMMYALHADPRYMELCRKEGYYAARLDVKPERCRRRESDYAVTQYLWYFGNPEPIAAAAEVIEVHDRETAAHTERPLA